MSGWAPPGGSNELPDEPGWWTAPNGDLYSDPMVVEQLKAMRREEAKVQDQRERADKQREAPQIIEGLVDRLQTMEIQLFLTERFLEEAMIMLNEQAEQLQTQHGLLGDVLRENPSRQLRAA